MSLEPSKNVEPFDPENQDASFLRTVLTNISDAIFVINSKGELWLTNDAGRRMIGLPARTGMPREAWATSYGLYLPDMTTLYPADQHPLLLALQGIDSTDVEFFIRNEAIPNGIFVSQNCRTLRDAEGTIIGAVAVARDVTETKKNVQELGRLNEHLRVARDRAIEASSLKSLFVANVSHELRTPLAAILGLNELLLKSSLDTEQQMLAQQIKGAGDSLLIMINDLLDLARMEAGKVEIECIELNLPDLVEECVVQLRPLVHEKHLPINIEIDEAIPSSLFGDPLRIRQILVNLLSNAIKFTETGEINVTSAITSDNDLSVLVKLSVSDSGIGISESDQATLFNPFSQADYSITRQFGGSGLGLSLSRRLAELMGGTLNLRSKKGIGTTVELSVPLSKRAPEKFLIEERPNAYPPRAADWSKDNVLVVEDNGPLQYLTRKSLEVLGVGHITVVGDGYQALQEVSSTPYSLILMDCGLPGISGYDTTRKIRDMEKVSGRSIPIIAMTAGVMAGDKEKCLMAGMNDFLAKPYTLEQLRQKLILILGQ